MARIAYVDGQYVSLDTPAIYVEDRGYQFADGVYEVCALRDTKLIDQDAHLKRLDYSLHELGIAPPVSHAVLKHIIKEIIRRNRLANGLLYIQVTRGVAKRDHNYTNDMRPFLVVTGRPIAKGAREKAFAKGKSVVTLPDLRWKRCDIKSISLLPNVLARKQASDQGCDEAWLVDENGFVTEAASANAWIVDQDGVLRSRKEDHAILNGITRQVLFHVANKLGLPIELRPFTVEEALNAKECFSTASTLVLTPVLKINGQTINTGEPGPFSKALAEHYDDVSQLLN